MREYWTELDNSKGLYEISNLGNIRNVKTRRNLSKRTKDNGLVIISINNQKLGYDHKKLFLAQEVYKHFTNKPFLYKSFKIFYSDGNKQNCNIENLTVLKHVHTKPTDEQIQIFENEIYQNVKSVVYYNYGNNNNLDLEELIQESVLTIYKYLPNYTQDMNFKGFCRHYVTMTFLKQYNISKHYRNFTELEQKYLGI